MPQTTCSSQNSTETFHFVGYFWPGHQSHPKTTVNPEEAIFCLLAPQVPMCFFCAAEQYDVHKTKRKYSIFFSAHTNSMVPRELRFSFFCFIFRGKSWRQCDFCLVKKGPFWLYFSWFHKVKRSFFPKYGHFFIGFRDTFKETFVGTKKI